MKKYAHSYSLPSLSSRKRPSQLETVYSGKTTDNSKTKMYSGAILD